MCWERGIQTWRLERLWPDFSQEAVWRVRSRAYITLKILERIWYTEENAEKTITDNCFLAIQLQILHAGRQETQFCFDPKN